MKNSRQLFISFSLLTALLALTAWIYAPVRSFAFVTWDDMAELVGNTNITRGLSADGMWWALTYARGNWLPLTSLSHMLDWSLFGMNGGGHHITSAVIHLLNTALLFAALRRLTGSVWRSWIVAALFAAHPLHVESVAWISERKDVLCACFMLGALWAYASYARSSRRSGYYLALALFVFSAMAKPMVMTFPILLLLVDVWPLARISADSPSATWRPRLIEKLPFVAIAAATAGIALYSQSNVGAMARLDIYPLPLRLSNAVLSYVKYIGKMFWPVNLAAYYPLRPRIGPPVAFTAAALVALTSMTALAAAQWRRRPYIAIGWAWYLVMLLPVIGIVQIGDQAMADRYTYLPMIGLFVILAWGGAEIVERLRVPRPAALTAAAAVVIVCAVTARAQTMTWENSNALWARSLAAAPDHNFRAHAGLGDAQIAEGRVDIAIIQYRLALEIIPGSSEVHNNLGNALEQQNDITEAADEYRTAIHLDAMNPEPLNNLGVILARQGQITQAIEHYEAALRLSPTFGQAQYNLAMAFAAEGRIDQAIEQCLAAIKEDNNRPEWHNSAARLLATAGRRAEAVEQLQAALAVDPNNATARQVLTALNEFKQ